MKNEKPPGYPPLSKSYKGLYPFKLGTTSFIYPDDYIPNVKMLGPYVDEIELLLFESQSADSLPSERVVAELSRLAEGFDLSYNVHLPTDISISDPNPRRQQLAVETMIAVAERVEPLNPTALILHAPCDENPEDASAAQKWRDRVQTNLAQIASAAPRHDVLAIESLNYPLEWIAAVVHDLDLRICLDLGHLMVYDYDLRKVFDEYGPETSVIHLHGVKNHRDHLSLEQLSGPLRQAVLGVLKRFAGVVSIEVFSFEHLDSSLRFLERHWGNN